MFKEFRDFIAKGNVIDLAIAVIIGSAFNQVVNSIASDVLMPIVGYIGGSSDFSSIKLGPIFIGKFLNAAVHFIIVSVVIFFGVVKPMNKLKTLRKPKDAS